MADYLACGNIMLDVVEQADGSMTSPPNLGGPAFFALEGIRLFTPDCKLVSRAGADFEETYGLWMERNGVSQESVKIAAEHCTQHILKYDPDGSGRFSHRSKYGGELLGYLKTSPENIEAAAQTGAKGIYLAQNTDTVFWRDLYEVKSRCGFKIMWEIEAVKVPEGMLQRIQNVIRAADMFSVNLNEASELYHIPKENEEDIINEIMKLPVELTLFRVGKRGAYAVSGNSAVFCRSIDIDRSVDPTGCGNSSTGAAMFAHVAGYDPAMAVIMANIAAGYNAAQYGVYPHFTDDITKSAYAMAHTTYMELTGRQHADLRRKEEQA